MPDEPTGSRWELVRFGLSVAAALFFAMAIPLAAAKVADFHHLWLGGHLVATGQVDALYDAGVHKDLLAPWMEVGDVWAPRNDRLGAFFYPPTAALAYAALGWLPVVMAKMVMGGLALVAAGLAAFSLSRLGQGRLHLTWIIVLLALAPPFFYDFGLGQNGTVALAALALGAWLMWRRQDLAAGVVAGLLFALKPSWALSMGWIPLVLGRWRALAGMALAGVGAVGLSAAVLGVQPWVEWLAVARDLAMLDKLEGYPLENQHNALAVARQALGVGLPADVLGWGAALSLVGATLWRLRSAPATPLTAAALLVLAGAWLNPHLHHYDVLVEVVGVVALAAALPSLSRAWRVAAVAAAASWYLSFPVATDTGLSFPSLSMLGVWVVLALGTRRSHAS